MASPLYTYRATVLSVHDGDSLKLAVDVGFNVTYNVTCRLNGINARELAEPGGQEAAEHLAALCPFSSTVLFRSLGADKYGGRWLGVLTLLDGRDVATTMIRDGYAAPWDGRGPRPLPPWPIGAPSA